MGFVADTEQQPTSRFVADEMPPAATEPAPKRKAFSFGNDSTLNAAEAFGEANKWLEHKGYQAGEGVSDVASKVLPPEGAAGLGLATNVGVQMIPALLGGEAGKLVSPGFQSAARNLMQSAIKPTVKDALLGKADRAAQTLLDEGINITRGGMEALREKGTAINNVVDSIIGTSGSTVDKGSVASRIQDVVKRIEKSNPTPQDALADVEKVYDQFMTNGVLPKDIPLARAQELKQGIYQMLKEKYGTLGSDTVEAQKALARGFKELIEAEKPAVAPLNAKASEIWNALNVAQRRVMMQGNNQVGGLAWLAHNPLTWAASMADRSSLVKSLLARAMNSGSERIPQAIGNAAGGAAAAATQQAPTLTEQQQAIARALEQQKGSN